MIVVGMLFHLLTNPEHYYDVSPSTTTAKPSPESAFQKWATKHRSDKVVIVAASGGGIQAAAWTATVLTGLEHTCPGKFANSIGLISSVSGGSLGTMYFGSNYGSEGYRELHDPVIAAEKSSLAAAAWGIVYPDLLRTIAPGLVHDKTHDRGWAIEQAWKNHWGSPLGTLDDWRLKASVGEMPAIIFNATTSDTGEKFLVSNVDLPEVRGSRMWGYPGYTINVSTAARLSATFPYVTPISRANVPFPAFHVADGGYYDNFGIDSAIAWLRGVLAAHPQTKVLIVQIRASAHPDTNETNTRSWSWLHQGFGPLGTLLTTRTSAQLARNDNELRLLLEAKGKENILPTTFEFPKPDPPLSWHLTASDITEIKNQWSQYTSQSSGGEVNKVVQFLGDCSSMQQNFKSAQ